jgi:hypothetical protein
VARRMGKIYHALGLLPTDEFRECSASDLTTGYAGQSSKKTLVRTHTHTKTKHTHTHIYTHMHTHNQNKLYTYTDTHTFAYSITHTYTLNKREHSYKWYKRKCWRAASAAFSSSMKVPSCIYTPERSCNNHINMYLPCQRISSIRRAVGAT